MIIYSHCHGWRYWPYQPPVPDPLSRGSIDQLLFEMDRNGVDKAIVICACIDHNDDNNDYVAEQANLHTDRLIQFADIDSFWTPTYHQSGADERLRTAAAKWPIAGFTHYLRGEDNGNWLTSEDGRAFFQAADDLNLIASIACHPLHHAAVREVAAAFPSLPILVHHMGQVRADESGSPLGPYPLLNEVLSSATQPNIYLKFSGFAYAATVKWDFPYKETHRVFRTLYEHFGARRMCWGSDYPVVRQFMTYQQSLEAVRGHCTFIADDEMDLVLGSVLAGLLGLQ